MSYEMTLIQALCLTQIHLFCVFYNLTRSNRIKAL